MDRHELYQEILALPVWDTHTHLTPDLLPARSFWEIGHYFWFLRELQAAGYPQQPEALPEEARITAYLRAFDATRNTSMNWVVRHILRELYHLELTDVASIRAADRAIRQSAADPGWPRAVADKLNIQRICIHARAPREFVDLPGVACIVPIDANQSWNELIERIRVAPDPRAAAERTDGQERCAHREHVFPALPPRQRNGSSGHNGGQRGLVVKAAHIGRDAPREQLAGVQVQGIISVQLAL